MQLTIVCAVTDEKILKANLLKSKVIEEKQCKLLLYKNPKNIATALNEGKMASKTTHVAFIEPSVILPNDWYGTTMRSLVLLTQIDSDFGALGVAGAYGNQLIGFVNNNGRPWGAAVGLPKVAHTLDETLIITRKDNVWFDELLPSGHLRGADLCLAYRMRDLRNYIINAYCRNNNQVGKELPKDFKKAENYLREKYANVKPEYRVFPIKTTSTTIHKEEKKEKQKTK